MIVKKTKNLEQVSVQGVTSSRSEAKITICAVPDQPGIAAKIFTEVSKVGATVDIIVQNISHTRHTGKNSRKKDQGGRGPAQQ